MVSSTFISLAQTKVPVNKNTKPKINSVATKSKSPDATKSGMKFNSALDSVSYAVGVLVAQNFKSQSVTLNVEMVAKGFASVMTGNKLSMTEAECQNIMNTFMMKNQERQAAENAKQFFPNKEAGEKFLADNKKKDSVMTTASGLQYKVIKMGTGPKPLATDKVKTHYHGTLIDGSVFDSSVQRGEPVSFPVSGVIPGWVEALQLMPVGSKWKLYIPQELAYGVRGGGQTIKPYSALVFEVELLEIEK
ncbi:MAG: FKBP-type peptidyl-prolyl cis-trans isomerase [Cytophagia bacterium]|nr:FKBP-type peptidyl-prolyl cis-trans isomerase [Cytophagia bacterium]